MFTELVFLARTLHSLWVSEAVFVFCKDKSILNSLGSSGFIFAVGLLLSGCQNQIGGLSFNSNETPSSQNTFGIAQFSGFSCQPDRDPSATPWRRLSELQYQNSLEDLILYTMPSSGAGVWSQIESNGVLALLPDDDARYSRMDVRISEDHIAAYFEVALVVAEKMTQSAPHIRELAGCTDYTSESCVRALISKVGRFAYKRPLSTAEVNAHYSYYASVAIADQKHKFLVARLLMAADFLFHSESRGSSYEERGDAYTLTDYELASRLSYLFWQSIPNDRLLNAAASGELSNSQGLASVVDEVFFSGSGFVKTQTSIRQFYSEWLELQNLPASFNSSGLPAFDVLVSDLSITPNSATISAARDEVLDLLEYYTWDTAGDFQQVLLSRKAFTSSASLAEIYGVSPVSSSNPNVTMNSQQRAGLLTRVALQLTGSHKKNAMHVGAVIREDFLCEEIASPFTSDARPNDFMTPELTATASSRDRYVSITEVPGCEGCHTQMNPFGFAMESYDSLGRFRNTELIIEDDGNLLGEVPIDSVVQPNISYSDELTTSGPVELTEAIAESKKADACFVRNFYKFAKRSEEDLQQDACGMQSLYDSLQTGGIKEMYRQIVLRPEFRLKFLGGL